MEYHNTYNTYNHNHNKIDENKLFNTVSLNKFTY